MRKIIFNFLNYLLCFLKVFTLKAYYNPSLLKKILKKFILDAHFFFSTFCKMILMFKNRQCILK